MQKLFIYLTNVKKKKQIQKYDYYYDIALFVILIIILYYIFDYKKRKMLNAVWEKYLNTNIQSILITQYYTLACTPHSSFKLWNLVKRPKISEG